MDSFVTFELPMRDETYALSKVGQKKLTDTQSLSGERWQQTTKQRRHISLAMIQANVSETIVLFQARLVTTEY